MVNLTHAESVAIASLLKQLRADGNVECISGIEKMLDEAQPDEKSLSPRVAQLLRKAESLTARPLKLMGDWAFTARNAFTEKEAKAADKRLTGAGFKCYINAQADRFSIQVFID
jgi:hypothetical protein